MAGIRGRGRRGSCGGKRRRGCRRGAGQRWPRRSRTLQPGRPLLPLPALLQRLASRRPGGRTAMRVVQGLTAHRVRRARACSRQGGGLTRVWRARSAESVSSSPPTQ
eukprot:208540-Rhodomonas_salina.1